MDELVAFLRAALDRDEQVALEAIDQGGHGRSGEAHWNRTYSDRRALVGDQAGNVVIHGFDETWSPSSFQAEHIARWDPARVLAEVQAKRRILDLHPPRQLGRWQVCATCRPVGEYPEDATSEPWPCRTLRALAQPYAGQPGWRDEWTA